MSFRFCFQVQAACINRFDVSIPSFTLNMMKWLEQKIPRPQVVGANCYVGYIFFEFYTRNYTKNLPILKK